MQGKLDPSRATHPGEPGRNDAGVVEHHDVAGTKQLGKIGDAAIFIYRGSNDQ